MDSVSVDQYATLAAVQIGDLIFIWQHLSRPVPPPVEDDADANDEGGSQGDHNQGDDVAGSVDAALHELEWSDDEGDEDEEASESEEHDNETAEYTSDENPAEVAFTPAMYTVASIERDAENCLADIGLTAVTYSSKANSQNDRHVYHIYGTRCVTYHASSCGSSCKVAKSIADVVRDKHFQLFVNPNGDHIRPHIATNPRRRCVAECADGWLNGPANLADMVKDYAPPTLSLGQLPGTLQKTVCPVCVGVEHATAQQDLQGQLLQTHFVELGEVVDFLGRLNQRRMVLGYRFQQLDEREWGHSFDDMLSDDGMDTSDADGGRWQAWEEAMNPSGNIKLRPASRATIAALPRKLRKHVALEGDAKCHVCLEDLRDPDAVLVELPCGHVSFEEACIEAWLKQFDNCPSCRGHVPAVAESAGEHDAATMRAHAGGEAMRPSGFKEDDLMEDSAEDGNFMEDSADSDFVEDAEDGESRGESDEDEVMEDTDAGEDLG